MCFGGVGSSKCEGEVLHVLYLILDLMLECPVVVMVMLIETPHHVVEKQRCMC
jgi:hypothetical protein